MTANTTVLLRLGSRVKRISLSVRNWASEQQNSLHPFSASRRAIPCADKHQEISDV